MITMALSAHVYTYTHKRAHTYLLLEELSKYTDLAQVRTDIIFVSWREILTL